MSQIKDAINSLQDGILLAVNQNLQNATYDKTLRGRITGVLPKNIYKVTVNGVTYNVKSTSVHSVNDTVNVLVPQNNYNEMFILPEGITPDTTLPARGGNADTVNHHTVESDVPPNAVFLNIEDKTVIDNHLNSVDNPHSVTKSQLGLSEVDNKSSKTIRSEITAQNVQNALGYTPVNSNDVGIPNGIAELDGSGKVPISQLPAYLDILEGTYISSSVFNDINGIAYTPKNGKIYVDINTNYMYRWSENGYVEINSSVALGETSSTAYRGDRGKIAYDHSQVTGNPHGVTKSSIGLGNVDNTSDINKPISTATQKALDAKASSIHNHDDRYYDKPEIDTKMNNIDSKYAKIVNLEATNANIEVLNSDIATINTLINGNLSSKNISSLNLTASNTVIENALIKDAMIDAVSASKINAGIIDTNKVAIESSSGNLVIADNTIQIQDDTYVRVQIGKDASGDYNMYVWDNSGNLMFDATGIHESAIKTAIIRNDMVSENANIHAGKLDIGSLFTAINDDGTHTLNSSKISLKGQTLEVAFNSLTTTVADNLNTAKTYAESKATEAQQASKEYADAQIVLAETTAKAYADGIVTSEEQARINQATANLNTAKEYAEQKANEAKQASQSYADTQLSNYATTINSSIDNLQGQIDGAITTWFYGYEPTTTNVPASNWTTTELKNIHLGDLFYDTITGYCYRWQVVSNVYGWQRITDSDITKALADASKAQDTADSKRRVFTATPTTPYDKGDLWLTSTTSGTGDLYKCIVSRTTGSYTASDWVKATKYTDDTVANNAVNLANTAQATANTASTNATSALNQLTDIMSDNKITPDEKQMLKKEWDVIVSEKTLNDAQATTFGITTEKTNYGTKYTALNTYLNTTYQLFSNLSATTTIDDGNTLRSKFKEYYDARNVLLNAISAKAKSLADTAQSGVNTLNTNLSVTNGKISSIISQTDIDSLNSQGITFYNKYTDLKQTVDSFELELTKNSTTFGDLITNVKNNNAKISATPENIKNVVTSTYVNNNVNVGGRNLAEQTNQGTLNWSWSMQAGDYTMSEVIENKVNICTLTRGTTAQSGWSVIQYSNIGREKYLPNTQYTISFSVKPSVSTSMLAKLLEGNGTNTLLNCTTSCNITANTWNKVSFTGITPTTLPASTAQLIYITGMNSSVGVVYQFKDVKIELGAVATDWTPAPEDIMANINSKANADSVIGLTSSFNSLVEQTSNSIHQQISQQISSLNNDITARYTNDIKSTVNNFNISFSSLQSDITNSNKSITEMKSHFNFSDRGLEIGKSNSPFKVNLSNQEMNFVEGETTVASISGQRMNIPKLDVGESFEVGNHKIEKLNNNITIISFIG